jgi:A/G-specific adenine glycosylase
MRVLYRVFIAKGDPKKHRVRLWRLAESLIPRGKAYDFNQALMDFGAIRCTARTPGCQACPMTPICKTFPFGDQRTKIWRKSSK